jgi:hypothetical protein
MSLMPSSAVWGGVFCLIELCCATPAMSACACACACGQSACGLSDAVSLPGFRFRGAYTGSVKRATGTMLALCLQRGAAGVASRALRQAARPRLLRLRRFKSIALRVPWYAPHIPHTQIAPRALLPSSCLRRPRHTHAQACSATAARCAASSAGTTARYAASGMRCFSARDALVACRRMRCWSSRRRTKRGDGA